MTSPATTFTLDDLAAIVARRAASGDPSSYTAKLMRKGVPQIAKKLGEEAVEAALAAALGRTDDLRGEAADVLYHLVVLLHATGVPLADVYAELERRTAVTGPRREGLAPEGTEHPSPVHQARPAAPRDRSSPPPGPRGRGPRAPQNGMPRRPMDTTTPRALSPYRVFTESEWARLRADAPMTLSKDEVERLQSLNDPVSLDQVESIYLPLSRLLSFYVEAMQGLHAATERFLGDDNIRIPFVIGIAGSVRRRQVDHRPRPAGAARPLAVEPARRPRHHRRLPAAERRARWRRA